jgi:DNA transformation protein
MPFAPSCIPACAIKNGAMDGYAQPIRDCKSLGPKSQEMLARAGIHTVEQLRELGSAEAYVRAKHANSGVSLNLLWALESALTGEPWQQVAKLHRDRLLQAIEGRERLASQDPASPKSKVSKRRDRA